MWAYITTTEIPSKYPFCATITTPEKVYTYVHNFDSPRI